MPSAINPFTGKIDLTGTGMSQATADARYLLLDQTTPQTTVGLFSFPNVYSAGYLSVGNASPRGGLDVYKPVTYTIGDVTSGYSLTFTYNAGAYYSSGQTFEFDILAYKTVGGVRIYSVSSLPLQDTDANNALQFYMTLAWDAVSGAEGYRVIVTDPQAGAAGDYYFDTPYNYAQISTTSVGHEDYANVNYTYGNTQTPTSTVLGEDFYLSIDGKIYNQGVEMLGSKWTDGGTYLYPTGGKLALVKTAEHSSANPSDISLTDSNDREVVGLAAWNGGGGTGGYGTVVVNSYCTGGAMRLGEIGGKNTYNGVRLADFIFQTGSAADNGEIVALLGAGGGSFRYSFICSQYGTSFGLSSNATAKIHIAAGTASASTSPLKFTSGTLLTTAEAGAVEFLTDKFYGTITTGAARKELTLNDAALTSGTVPVATTNGRLTNGGATGTELGYLSGVTSAIQTQLGNKAYRSINLPVQSAKLPATNPARVDAGDQNWRLLFDATTSQSAIWQFAMPQDYGSGLQLRLLFSMNATQTGTNTVIFDGYVMADTEGDAEDVNSNGFGAANAGTETLVNNQTAGYLRSLVISLANADSVAAGDFVQLKIDRDVADSATGDVELVAISVEYTSI